VAYFKAKFKSSGDKASPCFSHWIMNTWGMHYAVFLIQNEMSVLNGNLSETEKFSSYMEFCHKQI
jgi:hypothetical protein